MDMKGFAILTIAIVGIITTVTSIIAMAIPLLTLKYHLAIQLKETYEYNNAELALLGLVSKKYTDTYPMYRVLSEHSINGFDQNMQKSLRDNLKILENSNCSKIVDSKATILEPENCEPTENVGEMPLFLPYNPDNLIERIVLVYS